MKTAKSKKLYRKGDDSIISGVCAGIGDYLGVKAVIVRVVSVVLLLMATVPTALCYLIATILLPELKALKRREF